MSTALVYENNRTQSVRLPADSRFPSEVKRVVVRVSGHDRILSPINSVWDSFFLADEKTPDDFMVERASQEQPKREDL